MNEEFGDMKIRTIKIVNVVILFTMMFLVMVFVLIKGEIFPFSWPGSIRGLLFICILYITDRHYKSLEKKGFEGKDRWRRFYNMTFYPPKGVSRWYGVLAMLAGGLLGFLVMEVW